MSARLHRSNDIDRNPSLDHLVRPSQQRGRDREAEGLRRLAIDHELERRGLLDRQITGMGPSQDLVHVDGGTPEKIDEVWPVGDQAACPGSFGQPVHHRQAVLSGEPDDAVTGMVFEISEAELMAADGYEVSDYRRVLAPLRSGRTAWVYVKA